MIYLLGCGVVEKVERTPDERWAGSCFCRVTRWTERRSVLFALAGPCAEMIQRGKPQQFRITQARVKMIRRKLRPLANSKYKLVDASDEVWAVHAILKKTPGATDKEVAARYEHYARRCYDMMRKPRAWESVQRIGFELFQRDKVNRRQIEALIG